MSSADDNYHLVLYIDSAKPKSTLISERLRQLCRKHLTDPYQLEIIDLRENPVLLEQQRIIAVPTLDVTTPHSPKQRFVGDLSTSEEFIIAVGMFQDAEEMKRYASEMGKKIHRFHNKHE
jgi:circadian clock protein KaiB